MRRAFWVTLLIWLSLMTVSAGVYMLFGLGWWLIAAGISSACVLLILVDVDEKEEKK